jgi:hypothetical protein
MPCRDYDYEDSANTRGELADRNDKLARIACAAMTELVEAGKADFLLIKNTEVREWWAKHQIADAAEKKRQIDELAKAAAREEKKRRKAELLATLSPEDIKILGIKV